MSRCSCQGAPCPTRAWRGRCRLGVFCRARCRARAATPWRRMAQGDPHACMHAHALTGERCQSKCLAAMNRRPHMTACRARSLGLRVHNSPENDLIQRVCLPVEDGLVQCRACAHGCAARRRRLQATRLAPSAEAAGRPPPCCAASARLPATVPEPRKTPPPRHSPLPGPEQALPRLHGTWHTLANGFAGLGGPATTPAATAAVASGAARWTAHVAAVRGGKGHRADVVQLQRVHPPAAQRPPCDRLGEVAQRRATLL